METIYADQWEGFLTACISGVALALFYDVFRVSRALLRPKKRSVFLQDLIFMSAAALVTFLLALATNDGILRFYLLAGEGLGMCVYFLTVGEITVRLARLLLRLLRKVRAFLKRTFFVRFVAFLRKFLSKSAKSFKNQGKATKNHVVCKKSLEKCRRIIV